MWVRCWHGVVPLRSGIPSEMPCCFIVMAGTIIIFSSVDKMGEEMFSTCYKRGRGVNTKVETLLSEASSPRRRV